MDAYASVISNNMNTIMKQMTSISIILMIPTLIASLYGMNVPNALENNRYGIWIVIAVSIMLSCFEYFVQKKEKMVLKHCLNNFIFLLPFLGLFILNITLYFKVLLL
jgi:Mg2+ and Co2+ transporter CorA